MVHCLAKKGGSKEAHKMRGIMLLETAGKIFHGLARSQLLGWSLPRRLECQFGGFPHQQTLYATQLLRATTRVFKHFGMSGGVLFVDVKAAFHSLLRSLTFGGQQTWPQALVSQLRNDGINVDQIVESQSRMSAEFCNTAPQPLSRMMQDMHEHTWFTSSHSLNMMRYIAPIVDPDRGHPLRILPTTPWCVVYWHDYKQGRVSCLPFK